MSSGAVRITEYLELNIASVTWNCVRCGYVIGSARESYKRGLMLHDRDPRTVYPSRFDGEHSYAPDPTWCRIVEYYCPGCGVQMETEYLPPGHPLAHDIQIDVDALLSRAGEHMARQGK